MIKPQFGRSTRSAVPADVIFSILKLFACFTRFDRRVCVPMNKMFARCAQDDRSLAFSHVYTTLIGAIPRDQQLGIEIKESTDQVH
jgi:hypothetical protein